MSALFLRLLRLVFVAALLLVPVILVVWLLASLTGVTGGMADFVLKWFHVLVHVTLLLAVCISSFVFDGMGFEDMGLRLKGRWVELGFGIVLGLGILVGLFLFLNALGVISFRGVNWPAANSFIFGALLVFVFGAANEEMLFRGYILNHMSGPIGQALLISSLLFAVTHGINPGGISLLFFFQLVLAGYVMGYMYLWSGSLWLPFGFHLSWNLVVGSFLDAPMVEGALFNLQVTSSLFVPLFYLGMFAAPILALYLARWFLLQRGKACPWKAHLTPFMTPDLVLADGTVEHS